MKDRRGILYYNKDDIYSRNKYEGDFKKDKKEGKGIMYFNNGDRYEGDGKNGNAEGKGICFTKDGDRYEQRRKRNLLL